MLSAQAGRLGADHRTRSPQGTLPVAGEAAFALFALGLIGTELLPLPVLAGSAAYVGAELCGARCGFQIPLRKAFFYGVMAGDMLIGIGIRLVGIDPMKALIWAAVFNSLSAHHGGGDARFEQPALMGSIVLPRDGSCWTGSPRSP
ncbi:divalent metal cation transporter [Variovorax sp. OV329]|uniref:divalent metal cation transporter n=1 Tax=Variovorax sp. OV329 TaxID=1882825 RepID=UPI001113A5C0|nr:divalent metal cation transporter [Variovorax sp. OV329]